MFRPLRPHIAVPIRETSRRAGLSALAVTSALAFSAFHPSITRADTVITAGNGTNGGTNVTVVPGAPGRMRLPVVVVSATDTGGSADNARRAWMAANLALAQSPGYSPVAAGDYAPTSHANAASGLNRVNWHWPFVARDYQDIGKSLHVSRALSVAITPGAQTDQSSTVTAVADLYDTTSGALIGHGQATATATGAGTTTATTNTTAALVTGTPPGVTPPLAATLPQRAIDSAVQAAVVALGQPAMLHGVVISRPDGYLARLSLGTLSGLRNGATIEYRADGIPVAYGTVIEIAPSDAVATIAPETAVPAITLNTEFQTLNNPSADRAGPDLVTLDDREFRNFERDFAIGLVASAAVYYLAVLPARHH